MDALRTSICDMQVRVQPLEPRFWKKTPSQCHYIKSDIYVPHVGWWASSAVASRSLEWWESCQLKTRVHTAFRMVFDACPGFWLELFFPMFFGTLIRPSVRIVFWSFSEPSHTVIKDCYIQDRYYTFDIFISLLSFPQSFSAEPFLKKH